jgi:hypothetical protein
MPVGKHHRKTHKAASEGSGTMEHGSWELYYLTFPVVVANVGTLG